MKPNETFSFMEHNQIQPDLFSLGRFYVPLIGSSGLSLYIYFQSFYDLGLEEHLFSDILNHLNFGIEEFEKNLAILTAVKLVSLSQKEDDSYMIELHSPLTKEAFLKHQVLSKLLERKIGEHAFKRLSLEPESSSAMRSLDKGLSEFFQDIPDLKEDLRIVNDDDFDLLHFKQLMARDQLRFEDEQSDTLALFNYAELGKKTWFETYQVAKETAVGQVISTKRMMKTLESASSDLTEFTQGEQSLIRWAKSRKPLEFLRDQKQFRQASITNSERQVLKELAQLGLLDSVINVLVHFTLTKTDSANLNEKYALKLGNDLSYKGVSSAETAVIFLREPRNKEEVGRAKKQGTNTKTNVPEWSKESYRTEATAEELEELEALRRRMLGDKEV
ncbi:DNA helicase [Streptococcus merionis]|uniref:DNA helicase n=1 Tax=Streptococcus merionis TaxID=400065 RepID=UPI00351711C2